MSDANQHDPYMFFDASPFPDYPAMCAPVKFTGTTAPDKFEEKYKWFNDGGFILEHKDGGVWLYEVSEGGGEPFYLDRFKNGEEAKAFADKLA